MTPSVDGYVIFGVEEMGRCERYFEAQCLQFEPDPLTLLL